MIRFSRGAGTQAAKILTGLRDSYAVDFGHLFATEVMISLDENFQPTDVSGPLEGVASDSGLPAAYQGTQDVLLISKEDRKVQTDDAKTHMRPYNPDDTFQGKMYALFDFQLFPWAEEVKFRLVFTRYKNLVREIVYKRSDLPMLIDAVRAARERQKTIHETYNAGGEIEAIPNASCIYCPLLSNRECPVSEFNPSMQLSPEDRLKFHIWYGAFSSVNNKAMKDYIQGTGRNVILRDYNGKHYVYGPTEKESNSYPLFARNGKDIMTDPSGNPVMPIIGLLLTHREINPEDCDWLPNIVISSSKLESYLKASKRVITHNAIVDTADKVTKVTLKVSKPLDSLDEVEDLDSEELDDDELQF